MTRSRNHVVFKFCFVFCIQGGKVNLFVASKRTAQHPTQRSNKLFLRSWPRESWILGVETVVSLPKTYSTGGGASSPTCACGFLERRRPFRPPKSTISGADFLKLEFLDFGKRNNCETAQATRATTKTTNFRHTAIRQTTRLAGQPP